MFRVPHVLLYVGVTFNFGVVFHPLDHPLHIPLARTEVHACPLQLLEPLPCVTLLYACLDARWIWTICRNPPEAGPEALLEAGSLPPEAGLCQLWEAEEENVGDSTLINRYVHPRAKKGKERGCLRALIRNCYV